MTEENTEVGATGECGACRAVIPLDSEKCPECNISFSGVSDDALGECGACHGLVPLDSTKCSHCGTVFIADDVVDVLRNWLSTTGITIPTLFNKFDTDGDGQIDSAELKTGLLSLNLADLPPSQVERLIETIDADGDGRIDLGELHQTITGEEIDDEGNHEAPITFDDEDEGEEETTVSEEDEDEAETSVFEEADEELSVEEDIEEEEDEETVEDEDVVEEEDLHEAIEEGDEHAEELEHESKENMAVEDERLPLIRRIADAMDEEDISPNRFFNDLDRDASGGVDVLELANSLSALLDEEVTHDDIEAFLSTVDEDGDRTIDMIEFIAALEELEDADEAIDEDARISKPKVEKIFPSPMQKRMMGKQWNDIVWPLIHFGIGLMLVMVVLNALGGVGPLSVDGTGGTVALDMDDTTIHPVYDNGDIYQCDPEYQTGDCKNSLTPFGKHSSMPAGWYADGIFFALLSLVGLGASLYAHLVVMKSWRARAKAMKEVNEDKAEATAEDDTDAKDDAGDLEDEMEEALEEELDEEDLENAIEDEVEGDDGDEEDGESSDDDIDIGSHIGLALDDEEVFGTIIEFDDDEETVTIEEDETGDIITGYQEDMFVE